MLSFSAYIDLSFRPRAQQLIRGLALAAVIFMGTHASVNAGDVNDQVNAAWQRCEAPTGAAMQESCDILALVHGEIQSSERRDEVPRLRYMQRSIVRHLLQKGTIISNAEAGKICRARLPIPPGITVKEAADAMVKLEQSCTLMREARELADKQILKSPKPVAYYGNLAAERIASDAVRNFESAWLKTEQAAHLGTKNRR